MSIFSIDKFKLVQATYFERVQRMTRYWSYYKGTVYDNRYGGAAAYLNTRIASSIRPLFTPLARAVNLDVSLIPGGWVLREGLGVAEQEFIETLFMDSGWPITGDLFVRYVVAMGEGALWVKDDRVNKQAVIQAIRPDKYMVGDGYVMLFHSQMPDEVVDVVYPQSIERYQNGKLISESENLLGFIPLIECKNDNGAGYGEPTFEESIASLDQVNLQATHLANIIQKHVEPQWAAFGAEPADLEKSGDSVWFFPDGSDVKAVLAAVDFAGVLAFIQEIKNEVKDSLPELSLTKLVGSERIAAATIELQMAEPVFKIKRLRKPIDLAVDKAIEMAGWAVARMNPPYSTTDMTRYSGGYIDPERPVITLDALTKAQIEQANLSRDVQKAARRREELLTGDA